MKKPNLDPASVGVSGKQYAIIRHSDDGYDYVDTTTQRLMVSQARACANKTDAEIPGWAKANKQIGIAVLRVSVEEVFALQSAQPVKPPRRRLCR